MLIMAADFILFYSETRLGQTSRASKKPSKLTECQVNRILQKIENNINFS